MTSVVAATEESFRLGEGPVWDGARHQLWWVDILGRAVLRGRLDGRRIDVLERLEFDDGMIGAVAVADDGGLLVAAQEHLLRVTADGARVHGPRVLPAGAGRRLNDGAVDPAGRFLVGSLSLGERTDRETLVRLEPDGSLSELDGDLGLSNGLAWSADGRTMFSVDTLRGTVFVRDYDVTTGAVGPRRTHLTFDDGTPGHPDGITLDAEDHLWVAMWGGGEVRRFAPDGTLVSRLEVPAPNTTSVAFAGADLRTLVITTARHELTEEQLADFPDAGRLFTVRTDVPGQPMPTWKVVSVERS